MAAIAERAAPQRQRIERIRFDNRDHAWAEAFRQLPGTCKFGLRAFPSSADYHRAVRREAAAVPAAPLARIQASAQRDWHTRGQSGCMFARLAALHAGSLRWDQLVVHPPPQRLGVRDITRLAELLDEARRDNACELVSVLMPAARTSDDLVRSIRLLVRHTSFWLERDEVRDGWLQLHLRYPVSEGVQAWVMAFGPLPYLPATRRSPYFELAIRIKPKPRWIFHRLNQDREVAHLADVPLVMSDDKWEHRWSSTIRRTRMILGGAPDAVSAAKATLTVPG